MNTEEKIKVMQGYLDGKTVQINWNERGERNWSDLPERGSGIHNIDWNWEHFDYRLKPNEPRVKWFGVFSDGSLTASSFATEKQAIAWVSSGLTKEGAPNGKAIKFVEDMT